METTHEQSAIAYCYFTHTWHNYCPECYHAFESIAAEPDAWMMDLNGDIMFCDFCGKVIQ